LCHDELRESAARTIILAAKMTGARTKVIEMVATAVTEIEAGTTTEAGVT